MRDYATISKRLRQYSENCVAYKLNADFANAVTAAADAIEELLAENKAIKQSNKDAAMRNKLLCDEISRMKEKVPKWVSVEERLPEEEKPVFVTYIGYNTGSLHSDMIAYQDGEGDWRYYDGDNGSDICKVDITHWMPLPTPPKGVE